MNVAVYCRVSSEDQAERGTIQNQVEFAVKYCDLHQFNIVEWYKDDGITGTLPLDKRSEGKRMLEDAKLKRFDTILIYKLDRLGRSARIIINSVHELESYGILVKSMTEPFDTQDPSGRFMLTILAGVADLERETILSRMWYGANRAAKAGKWLGGIVPYGYYVNEEGLLTINDSPLPGLELTESDVIRLIYKLIVQQHYSTIKIADYLNALGVPPSYTKDGRSINKGKRKESTSGVWRPSRIGSMIKNPTYKGKNEYGKRSKKERELIIREVPPIVTEEVWDAAQKVLRENQINSSRNAKREYLLKGLIKCGTCGLTYCGVSYSSQKRSNKAYYVCDGKIAYRRPNEGRCSSKNVPCEYIEDIVWNDIVNFINNPGEAIAQLQENMDIKKSERAAVLNEKKLLEKSILDKETEKQSILELYRKKIINISDVEKQLSVIASETDSLKSRVKEFEEHLNTETNLDEKFNSAKELLSTFKEKMSSEITFKDKRDMIKTLIQSITINSVEKENGRMSADIVLKYNFSKVLSSRVSVWFFRKREALYLY